MDEKTLKIKKLKERFQTTFTVAILFPVVIGSLINNSESSNKITVAWGVVLGVFILNYILIEILDLKITLNSIKIINICFLIELSLFAVIMLSLGYYGINFLLLLSTIPLLVLIGFISSIPTVQFIILLVNMTIKPIETSQITELGL